MMIWLMEIWPKAFFCNVFLSKKFLFCLFQWKYPSQEHIFQNSIVLKLKAGLLFNDYHHHRHHPNLSHEIHSCPHMHDKDSDSRMIYMQLGQLLQKSSVICFFLCGRGRFPSFPNLTQHASVLGRKSFLNCSGAHQIFNIYEICLRQMQTHVNLTNNKVHIGFLLFSGGILCI